MGGAVSAGENNEELVDNLVEADYIKCPMIEKIFRAVDRGNYYLDSCRENAYRDLAWKQGNLHLSAPCIYAEVMESLKLKAGLSFLNLGSGTGYLNTMAGLILGPSGVNHGVELHPDVVKYARQKLEHFKKTSPALDEFEFCEPKFTVGNCLLVDATSLRQYDRVYCGASCPSEQESYIKSFLKVGGILVMPLNDNLLQIIRVSENSWDVKSVLPVSFASLILPTEKYSAAVCLPETSPLSLQETCRSVIRRCLREIVDKEHNDLKDRNLYRKRRGTKRVTSGKPLVRRCTRRLVIPLYEESDGTSDDGGNDSGPRNESIPERVREQTSSPLSTVIQRVFSQELHFRSVLTVNGMEFDGRSSDESLQQLPRSDPNSDEDIDTGNNSTSRSIGARDAETETRGKRSISITEEDDSVCSEVDHAGCAGPPTTARPKRHSRCMHKRVATSESDSNFYTNPMTQQSNETSVSTCTGKKRLDDKAPQETSVDSNTLSSYTLYMCEKIRQLPLPVTLQRYINNNKLLS